MASSGGYGAEDMLSNMVVDNYNAKTCKRETLKFDCELGTIEDLD